MARIPAVGTWGGNGRHSFPGRFVRRPWRILLCYSKVQGREEEKAMTNVKCFVSVFVSVLRTGCAAQLSLQSCRSEGAWSGSVFGVTRGRCCCQPPDTSRSPEQPYRALACLKPCSSPGELLQRWLHSRILSFSGMLQALLVDCVYLCPAPSHLRQRFVCFLLLCPLTDNQCARRQKHKGIWTTNLLDLSS